MNARLLALAALAAAPLAGCGKSADARNGPARAAFGLTAEQRARIHVAAVSPDTFSPTVEVTGTVAFDGNRSTQVLAPISGPVTRLLVELGTRVTAGQALASVASPDFAADVAQYRKA
ncbi:MAG TPA: efflux RND transporter periplasmic adaptor subunit, partial [Vicinamibacteria bacterium]|nr:efflux RND transporter periplasmic adaptor subunit [Vicinamibacteria bacterium]